MMDLQLLKQMMSKDIQSIKFIKVNNITKKQKKRRKNYQIYEREKVLLNGITILLKLNVTYYL